MHAFMHVEDVGSIEKQKENNSCKKNMPHACGPPHMMPTQYMRIVTKLDDGWPRALRCSGSESCGKENERWSKERK